MAKLKPSRLDKAETSIKGLDVKPKEADSPDEWEVKDAADTLMKAEKIKKDKKIMPHVYKHLKTHKKAITSIEQLRAKHEAMGDPEEKGENDNGVEEMD